MGKFWDVGICVDCGQRRKVRHHEWVRAATPRCWACGARLEPSAAANSEHAFYHDAVKYGKDQRKKKMDNG